MVLSFISSVMLCVLAEGGFSRVGHFDPRRVRRRLGVVGVVPVPPLVRRGLGVTLRRVLPRLVSAEGRDVEIAPVVPIASSPRLLLK